MEGMRWMSKLEWINETNRINGWRKWVNLFFKSFSLTSLIRCTKWWNPTKIYSGSQKAYDILSKEIPRRSFQISWISWCFLRARQELRLLYSELKREIQSYTARNSLPNEQEVLTSTVVAILKMYSSVFMPRYKVQLILPYLPDYWQASQLLYANIVFDGRELYIVHSDLKTSKINIPVNNIFQYS